MSSAAARERDGDSDNDSLGLGPYDTDNDAVPTYAPAASAAERQAIVVLFKDFYAAAAVGSGARACSMLRRLVAETVVEEHDGGKGPRTLRGSTCGQIASKLFKQRHGELTRERAELRVPIVQVRGSRGWAVLYFEPTRESLAVIHREGGAWKLGSLLEDAIL